MTEPESTSVNPYDRKWIDGALAPLAARALSGEPEAILKQELVHLLWPWITRTANRMAAHLPARADRDAVRSEAVWEFYQSVERIDWRRFHEWPALLKARLRGAFTSVARHEDTLTRGQRRAREQFLAAEEQLTQKLSRTLSARETYDLAAALAPRGGVMNVLRGAQSMSPLEAVAEPVDDQVPVDDSCIAMIESGAVRIWIVDDLPPDLHRSVLSWLDTNAGDLPPRLRHRLGAHLPSLVARLETSSGLDRRFGTSRNSGSQHRRPPFSQESRRRLPPQRERSAAGCRHQEES
ncbi:hypothetical protein [Streptomyces sp. NPDC048111]|uniref:hypothetical protein n=1 Tax=Streptomyces sp. NPDC048111 TaxID=3365500 RepID=UPI003714DD30